MRIIFDTNIYFAATRKGFAFYLLQTVLNPENGYSLFISLPILDELQEKLEIARADKIFTDKDIQDILATTKLARLVDIDEKIIAVKTDPDDDKILECAVAAGADLIVTMDQHLLRLKTFRNIGIVHPKTFSYMFPK